MMSRAVLTKSSWLFAAVLTLGLMACSSDDSGDGSTDTTVDRGSDVDRDVPTVDTPIQDPSVDTPVQDQTSDQGGSACDEIGAATGVGAGCDAEATEPQCGEGGICGDLGTGAVCWQRCIPGVCDAMCTAVGQQCLNIVDDGGNPVDWSPGVPLGVCGDVPEGTQGAYEACGTAETGNCAEDLQCFGIDGISGALGMCYPSCGTGGTCPEYEGVTAQCALGAPGSDPTHCALICDPAGSATCPTGMECFTLSGGGICLWPES